MKPVDLQNHSTRLAGRLGGHLLQPCTKSQSQSHQGCPRLKTTRCFHQQRSLSKPAFRVSLKSSIRPPRLPNKVLHSLKFAALQRQRAPCKYGDNLQCEPHLPGLAVQEIIRCHSTANASLDHAPEHPAALNLMYVHGPSAAYLASITQMVPAMTITAAVLQICDVWHFLPY